MAHRCVRKFRLARPTGLPDVRHFHASPSTLDALAVPFAEYSTTSAPSSSSTQRPIDVIRARKAEELRALLSAQTPNPNRVWANYLELVQFYGSAKIPLDIHQVVLRKCAPPAANVRAIAAKHRAKGFKYNDDQLYESRYQRIIRNIRSAGDVPALADYHCVLELFAAVGNHNGAMLVFQEVARVGLDGDPKTYGLVLQALCQRLSMPVWHLHRPQLVEEVTEHCMTILKEMSDEGVPYTAYNVDLAFRILKETLNMEGFTLLLRHAYGVDLEYPDRPPLEYWDKRKGMKAKAEGQESPAFEVPTQLPFTTSAFNTALDYLGRTKNVSKLVQLFEVATTPLPSASNSSSFDDDDDDDFGVSNPQVAPYKPPHVQPNTTSFFLMIKWLSRARHPVLTRHYLLTAMELERQEARQLRQWSVSLSPDEIPAPTLSIVRSLFLPMRHLATQNGNLELLRWVHRYLTRHIRRKQYNIEHYTAVRQTWIESGVYQPVRAVDSDFSEELDDNLPSVSPTSHFSTFFDRSSSPHRPDGTGTGASQTTPSHFSVDFDSPLGPPPASRKRFDVDLHLRLLQRELEELQDFQRRTEDVLGRSAQRVKERLGRRVWAGKNVFLRDAGGRASVPRSVWRTVVNFREQREVEARRVLREQVEEREAKSRGRREGTPQIREGSLVARFRKLAVNPTAAEATSDASQLRGVQDKDALPEGLPPKRPEEP